MEVDEFSSVAAPYAATDPETVRYFAGLIRRARAPIVCADAGPVKGKALYAAQELKRAQRIWTETPFVAMQHEANKRAGVACCQCCFLPLLHDYKSQWRDAVTRWHAHVHQSSTKPPAAGPAAAAASSASSASSSTGNTPQTFATIDVGALDEALKRLEVNPRGCGLAGPAVTCVCGAVYCSRECQLRAFHESHALLCPRGDPCSAMGEFLQHTHHTNDIFLLVAMAIARVLSRYLVLRDVVKARAPIDMFYKKPWWEVVLDETDREHDEEHDDADDRDDGMRVTPLAMRPAKRVKLNGLAASDVSAVKSGAAQREAASANANANASACCSAQQGGQQDGQQRGDEPAGEEPATSSPSDVALEDAPGAKDEGERPDEDDADKPPKSTASLTSQSPQYLQEVLALTHQLLLGALESNLVRLERENQLCGVTVDELWNACGSVLGFEFFAALIGMFEMNNISLEIDHPFHALVDFFDADMPADVPHPTLSEEDRALVAHVRRVLQWEEAAQLRLRRGGRASEDEHEHELGAGGSSNAASAANGEADPSEESLAKAASTSTDSSSKDEEEEEEEEEEEDNGARGFLGIEGTALFSIMCTMNHSCDPNCTVLYTRNGDGHVVAIRDIAQGEELCICYIDIDMDLAARERNLREYQFTCHCSRCMRERAALDKAADVQAQALAPDGDLELPSPPHEPQDPPHAVADEPGGASER